MTVPDSYFWYSLASVLAIALIWVIQRHVAKTEKVLERLTDSISDLNTRSAVHDERITALEEGSDALADKIVMKLRAMKK